MYYGFKPYVPVAQRRRQAAREMEKLRKKGQPISPVLIEGRTIARTFWGKAWCESLERHSDYANRLPRGRTYVRNGSVMDLQVGSGEVRAVVSGSALYKVTVKIAPVPKARWSTTCKDCAGAIDSLVELLQGRLSDGVMARLCQEKTGLFPSPQEIKFSCSCPDWASMCKHVAAVLYGIGARLDHQPELLFKLRDVDEKQLIAGAGFGLPVAKRVARTARVIASDDLSELFGLDMSPGRTSVPEAKRPSVKAKTNGKAKSRSKPLLERKQKTNRPRSRGGSNPARSPGTPGRKG
jgi:uncharacterized Zn finger protein